MPEMEGSEKRQGLHLACFRSTAVESKRNSPARSPKMPAKCESQAKAFGPAGCTQEEYTGLRQRASPLGGLPRRVLCTLGAMPAGGVSGSQISFSQLSWYRWTPRRLGCA